MIEQPDDLTIPLNKGKILKLILISTAFVTASGFFIATPATFCSPAFHSSIFIFIAGILGVSFFGTMEIILILRLISNKPTLIFSKTGLVNQSGAFDSTTVPWNDMKNVEIQFYAKQAILCIYVHHPKRYIDEATSWINKRTMRLNMQNKGTPICIVASIEKYSVYELKTMIEERILKYN